MMNINVATLYGDKIDNSSSNNSHYKLFNIEEGICKYENQVTVFERSPSVQYSNTIQITNRAITSEAGNIERFIEVRFKDREIVIKDLYHFQKNSPNQVGENSLGQHEPYPAFQRRLHLFKQIDCHKQKLGKKITKNLAKNFIRAFSKYLRSCAEAKKRINNSKLKMFKKRINYNNSFIQTIIQDEEICPFFIVFLDTAALQWIQNSKILNKESHFSTVKLLKSLIAKQKDRFSLQNMASQIQLSEQECEMSEQQQQNRDQGSMKGNIHYASMQRQELKNQKNDQKNTVSVSADCNE